MSDYFETDQRIRDRLEALTATLNDPGLSFETKLEELHCAVRRIEFLEETRSLAESMSALADLAALPKEA